jgi:hypothetical protein
MTFWGLMMRERYDPNTRLKVVDMQTLSDINNDDDIIQAEALEKAPFDASGITEKTDIETVTPKKQKTRQGDKNK